MTCCPPVKLIDNESLKWWQQSSDGKTLPRLVECMGDHRHMKTTFPKWYRVTMRKFTVAIVRNLASENTLVSIVITRLRIQRTMISSRHHVMPRPKPSS